MNTNFEDSKEKTEKSPDKLTGSSFFSAYEEEETMSEGGNSTLRPGPKEKTQTQMMIEISTVVLEEMEKKKKDKGSKGRPANLEGWYEAAIRYDEQYKYYKAVQKPKRFQITDDKKKKVSINRMGTQLNEEERKKYMVDGRCFQCAKQGHMARDCPTKQEGKKEERKKLSAREAYVKIQAIVREQESEQQTELLNIMEAEGF
ncbi:hypothetical protein Moror_3749 [Moniliophthora roreri MCA 2997]|uniref:CCHC-type domain-containing protein n=1 Tax=Moniliophthora roreri (strain MCA 2997) TaxID=1381753 RepID=V2WBV7_MONRO|nr:hypothetical protein Moror_3749 [Moniliophthora roreri MCA 2997]